MAVLSDAEIQRLIKDERLISDADLQRASECSYSFVAGVAFHPGSDSPRIEFPGEAIVKPGEMIWIRTRERVKMPNSLVGFWWQTNSLSRKGLMLVNMSMVEPGYEGDLACLFVNFGKNSIPINNDTIVAKMVFSDIRGATLSPFTGRSSREEYDARLRELAINQPPSFLQVGELAANMAAARLEAIAAIKDAAIASTMDAKKEIGVERVQALADFKSDIPKAVWQSAVWAVAALALLTAASLGADQIKGKLFPDIKKVAHTEAEQALRDRLTISATPDTAATTQLSQQIKLLNARIAVLERKKK
jgi:deoxycytidine triphosphate deaminase